MKTDINIYYYHIMLIKKYKRIQENKCWLSELNEKTRSGFDISEHESFMTEIKSFLEKEIQEEEREFNEWVVGFNTCQNEKNSFKSILSDACEGFGISDPIDANIQPDNRGL